MRLVLVLSLGLACACSPASAVLADATPPPASPSANPSWTPDPGHVFRAGASTAGTPPCRSDDEVKAVLADFAAAFNSGDDAAVLAALSPEFWALHIHGQVAYSRDDAVRFVLERQRAGDRLEFRRVQINGLVGWDGAAHIGPVEFTLYRGSELTALSGKGALFCHGAQRGIKVLGLAG